MLGHLQPGHAAVRSRPGPLLDRDGPARAAHTRVLPAHLGDAPGQERKALEVIGALLAAGTTEQDRAIASSLRDMARILGAERATLWKRIAERNEFGKAYRWLAEGVSVPAQSRGEMAMPWIGTMLLAGSVVHFARHDDLPPEAATDLPRLHELNIHAAVMVPLAADGVVVGALSFSAVCAQHEWSEALLPHAKLFGQVLASVIARQEAERREREAQQQAAHAVRVGTLGTFAASLVHELTQPLAASLANAEVAAELLGGSTPDLDELRATFADIVADSRRAGDLVQQLRRFLRRGEVRRTELEVRELVDEVLRIVAGEAADKQVALAVDVADTLPKVMGDRVQIQQVLLNLVLNALEAVTASASGARGVGVRAYATAMGACIEVSDSGPGIDEQTLRRIFQPFFTTKPGGMGLGLSISRTIISAHGGTLSAHSTPGSGSTFRVELPCGAESAHGILSPQPATRQRHTGTVYVIDDDPSMCRAIERQLEREGLAVETFSSAQAYLDQPASARVSCIVSDVRMPGLSGLDLQATLAQADRELPMVFISGHDDIATTVHAMKAGAVSFLAKPFTKPELVGAVAEALARSRELTVAREQGAALKARYDSLTPRERQVFALVAAGLLNKIIADRLGAAEATVKIHRGRVMEKMGATTAADLVRMAERLAHHDRRGAEGNPSCTPIPAERRRSPTSAR